MLYHARGYAHGVTFCAVAPEHPLATYAARGQPKLAAFIEEASAARPSNRDLRPKKKKRHGRRPFACAIP